MYSTGCHNLQHIVIQIIGYQLPLCMCPISQSHWGSFRPRTHQAVPDIHQDIFDSTLHFKTSLDHIWLFSMIQVSIQLVLSYFILHWRWKCVPKTQGWSMCTILSNKDSTSRNHSNPVSSIYGILLKLQTQFQMTFKNMLTKAFFQAYLNAIHPQLIARIS